MLSYFNIVNNNVDVSLVKNMKGMLASISKQLRNSNVATIIPADGFGDISLGIKKVGNGEYIAVS